MRVSTRLVRALAQRGLRHVVPLVLLLASEAQGNACALSQPEVAARLALDVRTVRRQEAQLVQLGILRVIRGGPSNRRLMVIEDLDEQLVRRPRAQEVLNTDSPSSPQFARGPGHGCRVSSARQTGHEASAHIRLTRARARAESPLSDSSAREPALAPFGPWRSGEAARAAAGRASRPPEWQGPSALVDQRAIELHKRLNMWPNTLREVVLCARDHAARRGEHACLRYLDALERHCLATRRNPQGSALNGLRKWLSKVDTGRRAARQHVLEDVGAAKALGGLVGGFLRREVRHGRA